MRLWIATTIAVLLACNGQGVAQERCFVPQVGLECNKVGFAARAASRCQNVRMLAEPDSLLKGQPDFKVGGDTFDLRVKANSLDEACAFALRIYGSTLSGGFVLLAPR